MRITQICQTSLRIGCVIPFVTYNTGSRNLSFDLFDIHICIVTLRDFPSRSSGFVASTNVLELLLFAYLK